MDLTYLLWLQDFRNATDNILTPFFECVSDFAITFVMVIPIVIYWCINKRAGLYIIVSAGISRVINGLVKLTFCIYRPWIRDPRIIPYGDSIKTAGGYSFPSGHTMNSVPVYGGLVALYGKKSAAVTWLCAFMIVMTALARNYLGVHTPQDVVVGIILGLFSVYITSKIFKYLEAKPEKENLVLLIGLIFCVLSYLYMAFKPYPIDYVDGKILVKPSSMIGSSAGEIGVMLGIIAGRYVEKRFINFSVMKLNFKGIIFALIGSVIFCLMYTHLGGFLKAACGSLWGRVIRNFLMIFFVLAVWPFIFELPLFNKKTGA